LDLFQWNLFHINDWAKFLFGTWIRILSFLTIIFLWNLIATTLSLLNINGLIDYWSYIWTHINEVLQIAIGNEIVIYMRASLSILILCGAWHSHCAVEVKGKILLICLNNCMILIWNSFCYYLVKVDFLCLTHVSHAILIKRFQIELGCLAENIFSNLWWFFRWTDIFFD
jgi:hypothetical protein